jgi:hypothetical protein
VDDVENHGNDDDLVPIACGMEVPRFPFQLLLSRIRLRTPVRMACEQLLRHGGLTAVPHLVRLGRFGPLGHSGYL